MSVFFVFLRGVIEEIAINLPVQGQDERGWKKERFVRAHEWGAGGRAGRQAGGAGGHDALH